MNEHFAVSPDWRWYILFYFFLAGIGGGSYVLGALLRLGGGIRDSAVERAAFLVPFPLIVVCPILLALDLGSPGRFWHMLVNTTPNGGGLNLTWDSPMSVGVWALSLFGLIAAITFLATLAESRGGSGGLVALMAGPVGTLITAAGALLGLFVASYTGVLLSVSNQAVWSDTWTLGGLFLASGMSAAAVVVAVLARRRAAAGTEQRLAVADGWFALVELLFVVLLLISLGAAGTTGTLFRHGWFLLWVVVALGLLGPLIGLLRRGLAGGMAMISPLLVVLGVFALRAVIIFSPQ